MKIYLTARTINELYRLFDSFQKAQPKQTNLISVFTIAHEKVRNCQTVVGIVECEV